MDCTQIQSKTISFLRFPLAIMVVMIHLPYHPIDGVYYYFWIIVQNGICCVAVPLFALFSGYYFFSGLEDNWDFHQWGAKLKKRVRTLLVPYFLWNLIFAIWIFGGVFIKNNEVPFTSVFNQWWNDNGGFQIFFNNETGYPINWALWFIRDLMVCMIFAPIIYFFIKRTGYIGLFLLFSLMVFADQYSIPGLSISLTFFFSCGAFHRLNKMTIVEFSLKYRKVYYFLATLLLLMLIPLYESSWFHYVLNLFTYIGGMALFCLTSNLVSHGTIGPVDILSRSSFFIYISHLLFIRVLLKPFNSIINDSFINSVGGIAYCIISTTLVAFLCVVCYTILSRYLPGLTRVLCGGR